MGDRARFIEAKLLADMSIIHQLPNGGEVRQLTLETWEDLQPRVKARKRRA